ncbi:hypothetical protein AHF37_10424 [Paragonimus kellicotti]|nr:hypothetical protein AHF37_10424 [Paragonimus kellicotti]
MVMIVVRNLIVSKLRLPPVCTRKTRPHDHGSKKPTGPQRLANTRPHHPVPTSQMDSFQAVPLQRTGMQHVYPGDGQLPSSIDTTGYVARTFYDEKVQECLTLEETVEILNAKIRRLEHLINLKDHRIGELQQIIVGFRGQGVL